MGPSIAISSVNNALQRGRVRVEKWHRYRVWNGTSSSTAVPVPLCTIPFLESFCTILCIVLYWTVLRYCICPFGHWVIVF